MQRQRAPSLWRADDCPVEHTAGHAICIGCRFRTTGIDKRVTILVGYADSMEWTRVTVWLPPRKR